jgi:PAS domain S-box-containing protein
MKFERKFDQSPEFLNLILKNINSGIMTCDLEMNVTFHNQRIQEMFGFPDNTPSEEWTKYIKIFEADGRTPVAFENLPLIMALSGKKIVNSYQVIESLNHGTRLIRNNAHPIYDETGNISGAILTTEDSQDLARSLSRFQAIFEQSPLSIQILDKEGRTILVNSAYQRLWGISDEFIQDYILKSYRILEDPVLIKSGKVKLIQQGYLGETCFIPEFLYDPAKQGLPGRARWASGIIYPLKNAFEEVHEVVIMHQDFTDERTAQLEKKKLLAQVEAIVRQMPSGLMVADIQGDILLYNEQMRKLIGSSDRAKEVFNIPLQEALKGHVLTSQDVAFKHPDGQVSYFDTSSAPIHNSDGDVTASIVMSQDVTQEKRRERGEAFLTHIKSLLISTLDYDQILERVASSSIPFLADGCMVDIVEGKNIKRIVTRHRDPLIQNYMDELQLRFPPTFDSPQPTATAIRSKLPELIKVVDQEVILQRTFDKEHAALITKIGIRTHIAVPLIIRGAVIGAFNIFNSENRPQFDENDFQIAQELANYASVAIDNAKLYKDAKSAIQLRDDFISMASHELRTPITSLNLQIEVLNDLVSGTGGNSKANNPLIKKFLNNTNNQLHRLTRLVDDMLDISRISSGKLSLNSQKVNLTDLCMEVLDRFHDQLQDLKIEAKLISESPIFCFCDSERIDQVLTNFMTNAIRYGERKPIHVILDENENFTFIKVKDHGRGVDHVDQERIFNRFERAQTAEDVNGLGLGLYINQQIVAEHGGSINIESNLHEGSTFTVELPRKLAP